MALKVIVLAVLLGVVFAQPDTCATADPLIAGYNVIDVSSANLPPNTIIVPPLCGSEPVNGEDVWYTFNSGANDFAHLSTCDPYDSEFSVSGINSAIVVWSGTCASLTCVTTGENNCALATSLTLPVSRNTNYFVQVGLAIAGLGQETFLLYFELNNTPFNDVCVNAIDLSTEGSSTYSGHSIGALTDGAAFSEQPCGGGVFGDNVVWYKFDSHTAHVANLTTYLPFNNFDQTYDTQLFLFEGACDTLSACLAGENDILYEGFLESLWVGLQKNTTYYIAVSGFEDGAGRFAFDLSLHVESTFCDTAHYMHLPSGYIPSSTYYADHFTTVYTNQLNPCSPNTVFPISSAQWYTFNSGSYTQITIHTCASEADTQLYLVQGVCGTYHNFEQGNCVAYADGGCPSGAGAKLYNISIQQHHVYYVVLDSTVYADILVQWVAGAQAQNA